VLQAAVVLVTVQAAMVNRLPTTMLQLAVAAA
jgi:hypothetical protein